MSALAEEVRSARRLPSPARARAIRQEAGVSQDRMARELGVHRVTVARYEAGVRRPTGEFLTSYASLLAELEDAIR